MRAVVLSLFHVELLSLYVIIVSMRTLLSVAQMNLGQVIRHMHEVTCFSTLVASVLFIVKLQCSLSPAAFFSVGEQRQVAATCLRRQAYLSACH